MKKQKIFALALFLGLSLVARGQSGTNSPYSQFGLGYLSEQTSGFNRGMNGLALGFREHNQVNQLNPASYSSIDSLSFIFDVGVSGQLTNFTEKNQKINANNADLEYIVAGFRAFRHVGVSFGLIPLTNVGYNYAITERVGGMGTTTYTNTYSGSGGLHEAYLGAAWEPFRGFSFGANIGYLWGDIDRSIVNEYNDNSTNTISKYYNVTVSSYKLDLGLQYTARLSKQNSLTLGVTYSLGHKLGADPECSIISHNKQTEISDTTKYSVKNGLELPAQIGVGLAWTHGSKWKLGFDYSLQQWAKLKYPMYVSDGVTSSYVLVGDQFKDRQKFTFGGEYCPNEYGRKFFQRIHYRAGASYTTHYLKINGLDGPKEMSVSMGVGVPIVNGYNNRSILNVSVQYARTDAAQLIKENTFRINLGLTFNERWFAKWKVE